MLLSKLHLYTVLQTPQTPISIHIAIPKRNKGFLLLFYMLASKSRAQYGSIDTSNTNIRPLLTILWQDTGETKMEEGGTQCFEINVYQDNFVLLVKIQLLVFVIFWIGGLRQNKSFITQEL